MKLPMNRLLRAERNYDTCYWHRARVEAAGLWPLTAQVHVVEYDEAIFLDLARRPFTRLVAHSIDGASQATISHIRPCICTS